MPFRSAFSLLKKCYYFAVFHWVLHHYDSHNYRASLEVEQYLEGSIPGTRRNSTDFPHKRFSPGSRSLKETKESCTVDREYTRFFYIQSNDGVKEIFLLVSPPFCSGWVSERSEFSDWHDKAFFIIDASEHMETSIETKKLKKNFYFPFLLDVVAETRI